MDKINLEELSKNEKLIYYAVRQATREGMEEYYGMNGEQHKIDHVETIPKIKNFLDTREAELILKNKFWDEVKKDLYKFVSKVITILILGIVLVGAGIVNWSTLIKLIGLS